MFRKSSRKRRTGSEPVYLNVYDLTSINGYAYWLGLGVYHSGIQVHGVEYAYGAHDSSSTGIFEGEPRQCPGFAFRKSILIGRTDLVPRDVRALMETMAADFTGDTYNLISKNCNHFCNEASRRLTGKPIPKWVNRLANIGLLCHCVLPSQVAAVRQPAAIIGSSDAGEKENKKLRSKPVKLSSTTASSDSLSRSSRGLMNGGGRRSRRSASMSSINDSATCG